MSESSKPVAPLAPGAAEAVAAAPTTPARRRSRMGSTLLVGAATLFSRLLGLIREQLFAALLGAGYFADAFVVAFRIPNLLRDLFAEGALSAAFVPSFARTEKEQGPDAAHRLANKVLGGLLLVVGALTLLGIAFATPLVHLLAPGFAEVEGKTALTAWLAQIMMPFLPALSLAAVLMGMLNARGRFGTPALAPALFNVAAIAVGAGLWAAGAEPQTAVVGWSLGTLLGGVAQFAVQIPPLRRTGFRIRPALRGLWRDDSVRRIARLMAPAVLGLAATQVNIFINTQFASTQQGANAWLNFAFRLMYLPIGIFGVAIATVTATSLARKAAEKDLAGVHDGLATGMRHVAFLTIPSTVGLLVLAEPIIGLIYEHGRFTAADTRHTAIALAGYAVGLYAYSGVKVTAPAFYALEKSRVPLIGSAAAVLTNLSLNLALFHVIGYFGLALGTSLGALVNLAILTFAFRRSTRAVARPHGVLRQLGRVLVASGIMGGVVFAALWLFDSSLVSRGISPGSGTMQLVRSLGGVGLGALVYAGACKALRIREMDEVAAALLRRRQRA